MILCFKGGCASAPRRFSFYILRVVLGDYAFDNFIELYHREGVQFAVF